MTTKTSSRKPKAAPPRAATKKTARTSARAVTVQGPAKRRATAKSAAVGPTPARLTTDPTGPSKQARLVALLQTKPGATIDQMMSLTGWQAHTVRGAISGVLRKRLGLNVSCDAATAAGGRVYRIVSPASA